MVQVAGLGACSLFLSFVLPSALFFFPHRRINWPGLGWMVSPSVPIRFFLRSLLLVSFLSIVACRPRGSGIRYMSNKYIYILVCIYQQSLLLQNQKELVLILSGTHIGKGRSQRKSFMFAICGYFQNVCFDLFEKWEITLRSVEGFELCCSKKEKDFPQFMYKNENKFHTFFKFKNRYAA